MASKVRKRARTNARRLKFEAGVAAGQTNVQAGRAAGYAESTIKNQLGKIADPIRATMAEVWRSRGITEDFLAETTKRLLEHNDPHVRLQATHISVKVLDGYPAPKQPIEDSRPITIVFDKSLSSMMPPEKREGG